MAGPQLSVIPSIVDASLLMNVRKVFSKKDPSKTRQLFFFSLQNNPCRLRRMYEKKLSRQHGSTATHVLCFL